MQVRRDISDVRWQRTINCSPHITSTFLGGDGTRTTDSDFNFYHRLKLANSRPFFKILLPLSVHFPRVRVARAYVFISWLFTLRRDNRPTHVS